MFVKPRAAVVLNPLTRQPIPVDGLEVPEDTYWLRRVRCGDVALVPPTPEVVLVASPIPDSSEEQS